MLSRVRFASTAIVIACATFAAGPAASAQEIRTAPLVTEPMPVEIDSGVVANEGDSEAVVFSQHIWMEQLCGVRKCQCLSPM